MAEPDPDILRANLAAIRGDDPALADLLPQPAPAALSWATARNGQAFASLVPRESSGTGRPSPLCSKYDPAAEAEKLLADGDPGKTACGVLLGLGLGYHAEAVPKLIGQGALNLIYAPDPALHRAVLEQRDLSTLLGALGGGRFAGTVGQEGGPPIGSFDRVDTEHPLFDGIFSADDTQRRLEQPDVFFAATYAPGGGTEQTLIALPGGRPFLQEVRQETAKVTWPTRNETVVTSIMVVIMTVIMSIFLLLADWVISAGVQFLLSLG